jgi:hypothetical protein
VTTPTSDSQTTEQPTPSKEEFDAQAEEEVTARYVINEILPYSDSIENVLIMMQDGEGQVGFVTNLNGFEESLAFMERVKHRMLARESGKYNPGTGDEPKGS